MGNDRLEDPKQDGKTYWGHIESRITRRTLELEKKTNGKERFGKVGVLWDGLERSFNQRAEKVTLTLT